MADFPKLYHPDHPRNGHPDPAMRKTLTPCNLLRIGWKVAPEEFLKAAKS
jgi:hypothetical protein